MNKQQANPELFICHSSNDKEKLVRPLAIEFDKIGVNIFYDEFSIDFGQSILQTINKGLSLTKFGLIVFSESFFKKKWTKDELDGLYGREESNDCKLIFIWHDCDEKLIKKHAPMFVQRKAIKTQDYKLEEIVLIILKMVNVEFYKRIENTLSFRNKMRYAQIVNMPSSKIKSPAKALHEDLPEDFKIRIRLLRLILWEVDRHSFKHWFDSFRAEAHPSKELIIWERIALVYCEFVSNKKYSIAQKKAIYTSLVTMSINPDYTEIQSKIFEVGLTKNDWERLISFSNSKEPLDDFIDEPALENSEVDTEERKYLLENGALEDFTNYNLTKKAEEYYLKFKDQLDATIPFQETKILSYILNNNLIQDLELSDSIESQGLKIYSGKINNIPSYIILNNHEKTLGIFAGFGLNGFQPSVRDYEELMRISKSRHPKFHTDKDGDVWYCNFSYIVFSFLDELSKDEIKSAVMDISILIKDSIEYLNRNE